MKRLRRLLALALTSLMFTATATAAENPTITINGAAYGGSSFLRNGTTYISLRNALDTLGGWTVDWDAASATAAAKSGTQSLSLSSGTLTVDGTSYKTTIINKDGRLHIPLRLFFNAIDYGVRWDGGSRTVTVSNLNSTDYSESDLYWLSRIISAESRGESLQGQIAVGNVVLNRVASSKFPNTIYDVIFDKIDAIQFEPVANGTVYNEPTALSVQAAKLCLRGENAIGDCMYFYNPTLSPGTWIVNNCKYYSTIGCHRFYR